MLNSKRQAYFKEYYKKKKQEAGRITRAYKKHSGETEEERNSRLKEYHKNYMKKWYAENKDKIKAKRQEN